MSSSEVDDLKATLGNILQLVESDHATQKLLLEKVDKLELELAQHRRADLKPYYTILEVAHLLNYGTGGTQADKTRRASSARTWLRRKGITAEGHNKWPRQPIDKILGIS